MIHVTLRQNMLFNTIRNKENITTDTKEIQTYCKTILHNLENIKERNNFLLICNLVNLNQDKANNWNTFITAGEIKIFIKILTTKKARVKWF